MLAGCGGTQSSVSAQRLQSRIGLLEQRVAQLERTGYTPDTSAPAMIDVNVPVIETEPAAPAKPSGKASTTSIQQALKNAGFYQGSVDGKMGPMTRSAIREFQRVHGLQVDGVAGPKTWEKLQTYLNLSSGGVASESMK
ncbi:MAG TPA: peptidoglycan-binding domain-containing protein [bacterium]